MRSVLAPLSAPAFRSVAFAYTAGQVADWLVEVALALAVFDRTGSALASALVFVSLRVLPAVALPVAMGRSLAALSAVRALALAALTLGVDVLPVWALVGIGLADGIGSLAGRAGSRAATAQILVAAEDVRAGNAVLNVAFSLAGAATPVGAGVLVSGFGPGAALAPAAGLVAFAAVAVARVHGRERRRSRRAGGLRRVLRESRSANLLAVETLLLVLCTAAVPVELPYVKQSLAAGDTGYGVLLTAWGAGMVAGSVGFAALSRARLPVLAGAATLAVAAAYAVMGVAPSLLVAGAGAALGGAGNGVQWVAVVSWVQRRAPAELGWRVTAVLEAIAALAPGAGFLLGGVAVTVLDPRTCLLALAAAIVTLAAMLKAATTPRSLVRHRPARSEYLAGDDSSRSERAAGMPGAVGSRGAARVGCVDGGGEARRALRLADLPG